MAIKDRIAALDATLRAWEGEKAGLARQAAALDITENERQVFEKRSRAKLQKELAEGVRILAAEAKAVLASGRGKAADAYRKSYWKDNAPDMAKVAIQEEILGRNLGRAVTRQAAEALLREAQSTKEGSFAAFRLAPALEKHPQPDVRMLAGRAGAALDRWLESDPEFAQVVATQEATYAEAKTAAKALHHFANSELAGGASGIGSPLGVDRGNAVAFEASRFGIDETGAVFYRDGTEEHSISRPGPVKPETGSIF